jgi:tRNA-splicing ligase RtcB
MKVFNDGKLPILSWCENPEQSAIDQAINIANLPFAHSRICLMPDTHMGYGMPIGGVVALKGVVSPNMVGVDIGCGMRAIRTSIQNISKDDLKKIMGMVRNGLQQT